MNADALAGYLRAPVRDVEPVAGGQSNPTYFLTVGADRLVLRTQPASVLATGAHDLSREYRILQALHGSPVPVPQPVRYCGDRSVLGTAFYLMRRVDGQVHHQAALPGRSPQDRRAIYAHQAEALAALHILDWQVAGLGDLARPGSFLDRQVTRWTAVWASTRAGDAQRIAAFLAANRPPEQRALVHGDFKLNNLVFRGVELRAVLDWELATIGDPLLDLAHVWAATWATRPEEYGGVLGVDGDGIPAAKDFFAGYYAAAGSAQQIEPFHLVLALLRNAGIFLGIRQRAAAGIASAANAEATGRLADVYLDRALAVAQGEPIT